MAYIYVLKIKKNLEKDIYENIDLVSINRQNKIKKYKFLKDSYRSLAAALIVRYALCNKLGCKNEDLIFETTSYGKPFLKVHDNKEVYFNISHSGDYVVCAIDDNECGIDVESLINYDVGIAENTFHPKEIILLRKFTNIKEKVQYFNFLWTMKESYVKALGIGLSKPLSSFYVVKEKDGILISDSDKQSKIFTICKCLELDDNYTLSFVGNSNVTNLIMITDTEFMRIIKKLKSS
ncbi:4'-phosphopantetheinyl transferase superfamily protein [Clostridium botulinum]|nr:4'-phosphopantetheinyl transferase superfamily protein [Clostridium botulinum]